MSAKANLCVRWRVVCAFSVMFVVAGSHDSRAVDPARIRQQTPTKTEEAATQRRDDSDHSSEVEQQRVPRDRDRFERENDSGLNGDVSPEFDPPPWYLRQHWMLGVGVQYLDTGAHVTRVYRNTPAWRFGLEPRDIIVSIDGYQIGHVNGRLYDLRTELNVRARRSGWVRLLVQNRRNDRLLNVDVQLARFGTDLPRQRGIDAPSESEIHRADEFGRQGAEVNPNEIAPNSTENGKP